MYSYDRRTASKSRDELVNDFYGRGIFLTPKKHVAVDYAHANRNIGFEPSIIDDLQTRNPGAGRFMRLLYEKGNAAWAEYSPEAFDMPRSSSTRSWIVDSVGPTRTPWRT